MKKIYKNKISISSFHIHKKVYNKYYLTEKYNVQTTNNRFFKKNPLKTKKKQKKKQTFNQSKTTTNNKRNRQRNAPTNNTLQCI